MSLSVGLVNLLAERKYGEISGGDLHRRRFIRQGQLVVARGRWSNYDSKYVPSVIGAYFENERLNHMSHTLRKFSYVKLLALLLAVVVSVITCRCRPRQQADKLQKWLLPARVFLFAVCSSRCQLVLEATTLTRTGGANSRIT